VLLRRELELALAERLPEIRRSADELALGLAAAAAGLIGVAVLTWAVLRALSHAIPDWAGGLILGTLWLAVAIALARRSGRPLVRAWARLSAGGRADAGERSHAAIVQERRNARYRAEIAVRERAEELVGAVLHELAQHEEASLEEGVEAVEKRSGAVIGEIVKWTVGAPTGLVLMALGLRTRPRSDAPGPADAGGGAEADARRRSDRPL